MSQLDTHGSKDTERGGVGSENRTCTVLALDVGTTSAKAALYGGDAVRVGEMHRIATPVRSDGTADPSAVGDAVDELIDAALDGGARPSCVALTCAWHGLVGVDAGGEPTTSLSTWYDTRAADEAGVLLNRIEDSDALHHRTGAPIHPSFPAPRLLRLRTMDSDGYNYTRRWCSLGEFLLVRWFGPEAPASYSMVSGTGMFDQAAGRWDTELLDSLGLEEADFGEVGSLPRCGTDLGLRGPYARRWPSLDGVPWTDAYGDGAAAVVGSGCESTGRVALTVGTSAAARLSLPLEERIARRLPGPLFAYLLDERVAVVGVARSNAGNLVSWARRVLRLPEGSQDEVLAATEGRRPGAHGLSIDPSLAGERSPFWPTAATGAVSGLTISTTALDVLQALLEASAIGLAEGADRLEEWAGPQQFVLSGGSTASRGWLLLLADATGRTLLRSDAVEASLRGAAALGRRLLDPSWEGPPQVTETYVEPNDERREEFQLLRERLRDRAADV